MITDRSFVVFADDWGRHPSSCQHLFRRLAPRNRVLWVNTIGTRTPTLSRADFARALGKLKEWTRPTPHADVDEPVEILRPVMSPFDQWKPLRRWNASSIVRSVRNGLAAADDPHPIVVTTIPNVSGVVGQLGESLSVYYCVDEFSEWPGSDRDSLLAMEVELLGKVDLVLATSEALFNAKSARHPRVRLLRHGVDWDRFRSPEGEPPPELSALPRPVFGFIGLVDARLDVPLIVSLARAFPEASFAFVGPRQLPECDLDREPNIHFLPPVPYDNVPAVLRAFDVSLLPYVENDLTERINPLKLRELLASGLPVVATPLPEVLRFREFVRVPGIPDEWRTALRESLDEGRARAEERSESVRDESWEARAADFSRFCREAEAESAPRSAS